MKSHILLSALLIAATPMQALAQDAYEVVRVGDSEMTCEALTSTINALGAEIQQQEVAAARSAQNRETAGRVGRGLLSGLARGASMMGYGGGGDGIGGAVAAQALAGVADSIASAPPASPAPAPAPAVQSPQQRRMQHLQGIHAVRPC